VIFVKLINLSLRLQQIGQWCCHITKVLTPIYYMSPAGPAANVLQSPKINHLQRSL